MDILQRRSHHRQMTKNPFDPGYFKTDELRAMGFGAIGDNVAISKDCTIIGPERIFLGDNIRIDSRVTIVASAGTLRMAGHNHIGGGCHLCVAADLTIGVHSGFSQGVKIYTSSDDYGGDWLAGPLVPAELRRCTMEPIVIGDYCVFGSSTVIMPGCCAADGVAVGALSLVTKSLDAWTLYHGNPARRIHARSHGASDLAAQLGGPSKANGGADHGPLTAMHAG